MGADVSREFCVCVWVCVATVNMGMRIRMTSAALAGQAYARMSMGRRPTEKDEQAILCMLSRM